MYNKQWFFILFTSFILLSQPGCRWKKNFYEIDPGKFYRSAQLDKEEFAEAFEKHGIKTVINFRGPQDGDWYKDEVEVTKKFGVKLINIPMQTHLIPNRDHLLEIFEAYESAERPILIHCKSGSDRTGLATTLYKMEVLGMEKEKAIEEELNLKYLHIRWTTPAQTYFMKFYQGKDWAKEKYFPCWENFKYYPDPKPKFCKPKPTDYVPLTAQ